jgi:hypothetical protein
MLAVFIADDASAMTSTLGSVFVTAMAGVELAIVVVDDDDGTALGLMSDSSLVRINRRLG